MSFNPFHATDLFWYPLKISENQRFSDVFRGYQKRSVTWNGLMNYFRYERGIKEPKMECFDVCGGTAHAFFHSYNSVLPLKTKWIPYFIKVNFVQIQVFYLHLSDRPFANFVKDKQLPRGTLGKKIWKKYQSFLEKNCYRIHFLKSFRPRTCDFTKNELYHRGFPRNFEKYFRAFVL